jgi:AraC-like DNA-binding protein
VGTSDGRFRFLLSNGIEALNGGLFVSPGFGTHSTRVIDSHELIFVAQGCLDMFEEKESLHVESNQALLLFPGKKHGGRLPYAPDLHFYWVHFRVHESSAGHPAVHVPRVADVRDPELLTELFCRFISDQESGILDPVSAAHLVGLMLVEASTTDREWAPRTASRARALQQAPLAHEIQAYIDRNFSEPITTSSIARDLRRSADYLERVFRRHRDMSILRAIHLRRITAARVMLRTEGRKNINEIAFACGYSDPGYFRRMFKRLTGLSPRKFRSLYSRTHINAH